MKDISRIEYPELDRQEVLELIFQPLRPDLSSGGDESRNILIPVDEGEEVRATFHLHGQDNPSILFFHSNREFVADYDQIGQAYTQLGINFLNDIFAVGLEMYPRAIIDLMTCLKKSMMKFQ